MNKQKHNMTLNNFVNSNYFGAYAALAGDNRIVVYVEGYADVAFWRNIFDKFTTTTRQFRLMTPVRSDLAKGKRVVLSFCDSGGANLLLCVDSDFDYLIGNLTSSSYLVNNCPYVVQTYTYSIENLQCEPSSLHSIVVKTVKNDIQLFNFEIFFKRYSKVIYPLFLWYFWAARHGKPEVFSLSDFRDSVKINYLHVEHNGNGTISWLKRHVLGRLKILRGSYPQYSEGVLQMEFLLQEKGISSSDTIYYMQGHTLLDNVVKPILQTICDKLRTLMQYEISSTVKDSVFGRNQLSYYNNSIRDISLLLSENTGYMRTKFYDKIEARIREVLEGIGKAV